MESLWMGVPVISLYGESKIVSRAGAALSPLGLGDWVAKRESECIELAQDWSHRLEELGELRLGLRERVEKEVFLNRQPMSFPIITDWKVQISFIRSHLKQYWLVLNPVKQITASLPWKMPKAEL